MPKASIAVLALCLWAPEASLRELAPRRALGFARNRARPITVVEIEDSYWLELRAAVAFAGMRSAARRAGIDIRPTSAFRTMAKQRYLYQCYRTCRCNGCNPAARPGWSRHQTGRAIDLDVGAKRVRTWLARNARRFGFARTVPREPWHYEFVGTR